MTPSIKRLGAVVGQVRHELAVDGVGDVVPLGHEDDIVPVADLDELLEVRVAEFLVAPLILGVPKVFSPRLLIVPRPPATPASS